MFAVRRVNSGFGNGFDSWFLKIGSMESFPTQTVDEVVEFRWV